MARDQAPGPSDLSAEEIQFFKACRVLLHAAGNPPRRILMEIEDGRGNAAARSSLSEWFSRKTIPKEQPHFKGIVQKLLKIARDNGRSLPGDYMYYETLRKRAEKARRSRVQPPRQRELLLAYMRRAELTADRHPAPGLARWPVPAFSKVYRPQRSVGFVSRAASPVPDTHLSGQDGPATGHIADGAVLHPSTVLHGGNCLVLAGPGGGKSSLLRAVLMEGLRVPEATTPVPVLLPARALENEHLLLPLAIAEHVKAEFGPLTEQDPDTAVLFASRPRPDAHWLLLVDGLDEIIDPARRGAVLGRLAALTADDSPVHQFVVTSRPLPAWELDRLGNKVDRLELQPFDRADLRSFAVDWFKIGDVPSPEQQAEHLLAQTEHSNFAALVRVPFMATILCDLHRQRLASEETGPARGDVHPFPVDTERPDSRGALYQWFTDMLQEQQFEADLRQRVEATLATYDDDLTNLAIRQSRQRIEEMAVRQVSKDRDGQAFRKEPCPQSVPPPVWEAVLRDIMLGTGLLTEQAGRLVFLHQTLAEYLAVRHLASKPPAFARTVRSVLKAGLLQQVRLQMAHPQSYDRPEGDSYTGFLLDRAAEIEIDCAAHLRRMVAHGGFGGSAFVVRQHLLGTRIDPDAVKDAVDVLAKEASAPRAMGWCRIEAIELLVKYGDGRGSDALAKVAATSLRLRIPHYQAPEDVTIGAGAGGYWHDLRQYQYLLIALSRIAFDPDLLGTARVHAAIAMEAVERKHVHDGSGLDALRAISLSALDPQDRKMARWALATAHRGRDTPPQPNRDS
ncbi:NACHT domain-containing NTPase [Streptomyces sp. Root264]|uniref:NACHT domain-containing protein n=1 Tax=Streptomyces sp. Root264 TaxID=1736503 RepID=UPI000AA93F65|nr:NACHT domain-containing protein [Streptomyces sp. Root264]